MKYICHLVVLMVSARAGIASADPVKRPDGSLFFPGRGCGINEKYTYLNQLPNDTSTLKCAFYYPEKRNAGPTGKYKLHFDESHHSFSNVFFVAGLKTCYLYADIIATNIAITYGHATHMVCQAICAANSNCEAFVWVPSDGGCYLRHSVTATVVVDKIVYGYVAGPKRCPMGTLSAISTDVNNFYPF